MAILIDTYNLLHTTRIRHNKAEIDYKVFIDYLRSLYTDSSNVIAYVSQTPRSETFIKFLQSMDVFVRMKEMRSLKNDSFDVEITLDALDTLDKEIVICSSSRNLCSLLGRLYRDRRLVYVHASGIPKDYQNCCVTKEITRNLLKVKHEPNPPA